MRCAFKVTIRADVWRRCQVEDTRLRESKESLVKGERRNDKLVPLFSFKPGQSKIGILGVAAFK